MSFQLWSLLLLGALTTPLFAGSRYDQAVLRGNPVLFLRLSALSLNPIEADRSGHGNSGRYYPSNAMFAKTRLPNGEAVTVFDGINQYVEVPSAEKISISRGRALTIEAWIRPDTLDFPNDERDGYVHWAGKGESGQHEYCGESKFIVSIVVISGCNE